MYRILDVLAAMKDPQRNAAESDAMCTAVNEFDLPVDVLFIKDGESGEHKMGCPDMG
jgi:hypothetical protein